MPFVSLDTIKTDRSVDDRTGLEDLASEMKRGHYQPIILWRNMTLIDGLRRIEAAKILGWAEIDAIVSDDPIGLRDQLRVIHTDNRPSMRRVYQFHAPLKQVVVEYHTELRAAGYWAKKDRPSNIKEIRLDRYLEVALNLPYRGYANRVWRLLHGAEVGDPLATQLLRQLEAGAISEGAAFHKLETRPKVISRISLPEQRIILTESIRSIVMVNKTLGQLLTGANFDMPRDEAVALMEEMKSCRKELYTTISKLAKEADKKR